MAKQRNDDLFQDTTMTFGEHLDELRVCLIKAVLGLVIASGFGLYFGDYVVKLIADPMVTALKEYYRTKAETDYTKWEVIERGEGRTPPYTIDEIRDIAKGDPEKRIPELIFEVRWVHTGTLAGSPATTPPAGEQESSDQAESKDDSAKAEPKNDSASKSGDDPASKEQGAAKPKEASSTTASATPTADMSAAPSSAFTRASLTPMLLWYPLADDHRVSLAAMNATEAFMIWLKASLVFGLILSSPWVFFQVWNFVAVGLYPHERKYVYLFLPVSLGLFLLGAATAYIFVFQPVLKFLFKFNTSMGINPDPRVSEWLSFVLLMPIGFGISFQLPLIMLFIERIGIFTIEHYLTKWRIAVLVIFVVSAVLTPADPYSIFLMAVPLTFLYFGGILLCKWLPREQPSSLIP